MRIYPVFQTFDIIGNSTEATRAAVIHPLKSPIRLLVPRQGSLVTQRIFCRDVAQRLQLAEHDLHLGPVTDWEWHSEWKCRQKDGCAEDNKSSHPV
jgi:hypothetical protein